MRSLQTGCMGVLWSPLPTFGFFSQFPSVCHEEHQPHRCISGVWPSVRTAGLSFAARQNECSRISVWTHWCALEGGGPPGWSLCFDVRLHDDGSDTDLTPAWKRPATRGKNSSSWVCAAATCDRWSHKTQEKSALWLDDGWILAEISRRVCVFAVVETSAYGCGLVFFFTLSSFKSVWTIRKPLSSHFTDT